MPIISDLTGMKRGDKITVKCDNPTNNPKCKGIYEIKFKKELLKRKLFLCTSCVLVKRYQNPEERRKQSERMKGVCSQPKYRQKISERMKSYCQNPEIRKQMSERAKKALAPLEVRRRMSESAKKVGQNPEIQKHRSETQKKRYENPKEREKQSERSKKMWSDLGYRKKNVQSVNKAWSSPKLRQKQSTIQKEKGRTSELRQKRSKISKENWQNPEIKQRRIEGIKKKWNKEKSKILNKRWVTLKEKWYKKGIPGISSEPQNILYDVVKQIYPGAIINDPTIIKGILIDVTIPSLKVAIEYDGYYFHQNTTQRDIGRISELHVKGWRTLNYRIVTNSIDIYDPEFFRKTVKKFIKSKKQHEWIIIGKKEDIEETEQITLF